MTEIKTDLVCKGCGAAWKNTARTTRVFCPFCGKIKDTRDRKQEALAYSQSAARKAKLKKWCDDPANVRRRGKKHRVLLRKRVFFKVCGSINPSCVRCGCDDPRLLEVNHKDGGGNLEMQKGKRSSRFYYDIVKDTRKTDDLELLCKPCNAIHCLELKYGPLPIKVVWSGSSSAQT